MKKAAHDILNKVDSIKNHADTAFKWKLSEDTITYTDGCIINNLVMNCPCSDTATYTIGDTIYCTCTTTNNSTTKK